MLNHSQFLNLIKSGDSFAWFRCPGSETDTLYISNSLPNLNQYNKILNLHAFWINPFNSLNQSWCIIPDSVYIDGYLISGSGIRQSTHTLSFNSPQESSTSERFIKIVQSAKNNIQKNKFQKVVLSAVRAHKTTGMPDFYSYFISAAELFPDAFVYCF